MRHRELLISEDKETIGIVDTNGKRHWWNRSPRTRMSYTWGTDMAPLISVAAVVTTQPLTDCNCGISMSGEHYCVGSYGGCERFNNREGRV